MKLPRRSILRLAACAATLATASRFALAQTYPTRPVRIVVTFAAGGSNDIHARLVGQWLAERLAQPFIVENRPGGGGNLGVVEVIRSRPDGHTLLLLSATHMVNSAFYSNLNYDLVRDITPIASFYRTGYVMMVNPLFPAKSLPDFIAYAKANPGKVNMGSQGVGSAGHLAGEMFKMLNGVDMLHVPYRGEAPALADLIGGHMHVQFATSTSAIPLVKQGQLRGLAVTGTARLPALPDIPTLREFVPGYELEFTVGMGGPKNMPAEIIERLNREINAGLARPEIKAMYDELGLDVLITSPAEFGRVVAESVEKFAKVVKFAGIKLE